MSETAETPETGGTATPNENAAPPALPDDHPLVKTLAEQKRTIRELKAKAQRLDDIENAQKSDAEKAEERIAKADQRATEAEARAVRREVALEHGLTRDDADLLDSLTDEDAMRRLATRLASAAADKTKNGNYAPREGNNPSAPDNSDAQFARSLFADGG